MRCASRKRWSLKAVDSQHCSGELVYEAIGTMCLMSQDIGNELHVLAP